LPGTVIADVQEHLDNYTAAGGDALVFTSPTGRLLRHSNFRRGTWTEALTATGLSGVHFHDLRHAGNHLVAEAGANLRELMERMGHASSRAALIYLHSTQERQRVLADAIDERARRDLGAESRGTYVARDAQADANDEQQASSRDPPELRLWMAPRAGLEPAAYCLGGKPEPGQTTPTTALRGSDLR
jgi:hypothetical protein